MAKKTASQIGKLSRRKGKAFECWVARLFTKATGVKYETSRNSGRTDIRSDVFAPSLGEPFIIECKHRREYELPQMMANIKSLQCVVDKAVGEGIPYIIIVKNQSGVWFTNGHGITKCINSLHNRYFYNGNKLWCELKGLKRLTLESKPFCSFFCSFCKSFNRYCLLGVSQKRFRV